MCCHFSKVKKEKSTQLLNSYNHKHFYLNFFLATISSKVFFGTTAQLLSTTPTKNFGHNEHNVASTYHGTMTDRSFPTQIKILLTKAPKRTISHSKFWSDYKRSQRNAKISSISWQSVLIFD